MRQAQSKLIESDSRGDSATSEFDIRALIIGGDSESSRMLTAALTSFGCSTIGYCAVAEAEGVFSESHHELVFLDFDEANGAPLAVCRSLRLHPSGDAVWIVVLTTQAELVEPALQAGANEVLLRPISRPEVQARIIRARFEIDRMRGRLAEQKAEAYRRSSRAQQQVAVAALGQWALVNVDVEMLIGQSIVFISQVLEIECCGLFELLPGANELLLTGGAGWCDGHIGSTRISAQPDTAEAKAILEGPVIVQDWRCDTRLRTPALYSEHQIRCSLVVPIAGALAPIGVLAAHSSHPNKFNEEDIHFLQAVAIVLSLAIERRRSEESIQRLAAFPRCNPNPVLELDGQAQLIYANEAAEEMTRSLGHASVMNLLPESHSRIVRSALATGRGTLHQQVNLAQRTLAWSFFPLCENQVVHCYAEEITHKLELETQLRQLQKMECVGQLAAGLAHDFNNVLTIVRGHTEILLNDQALAPKNISSLNKILGGVERASNLTRQLLTFSRRQFVQTKPLDINDCLASIVKMLDHVLGENIQLIFEPSRDLPAILGDSGMLDQVVMNLAVNARDAMPKGGRLIVTTSQVEVDELHVQGHAQARRGKFVCLSVTDSGCGMDADTLGHIFEPFFTTKAVGRGTGLGLATVYSIVQQHQGWIEVNSRVGDGTTFLVFLPCSDSLTRRESDEKEAAAVRGGNETILLVEDEPNLRELSRMILQDYGYRVLEAGSGVEALNIWTKEKSSIDLLLTDLVMPDGITGLDLGQKLISEKPSLKTVYASGYSSDVMGKESLRQHICFLQKPYPAQTLAKTIREALDQAGAK